MSGNTPVLLQKHVLPTPWMAVQTVDRVEHDAGGQNSTVSRYCEGVIWPPELPLHPTRGSENKTLPSGHSLDLGCRLGPEDVFSAEGRVRALLQKVTQSNGVGLLVYLVFLNLHQKY